MNYKVYQLILPNPDAHTCYIAARSKTEAFQVLCEEWDISIGELSFRTYFKRLDFESLITTTITVDQGTQTNLQVILNHVKVPRIISASYYVNQNLELS